MNPATVLLPRTTSGRFILLPPEPDAMKSRGASRVDRMAVASPVSRVLQGAMTNGSSSAASTSAAVVAPASMQVEAKEPQKLLAHGHEGIESFLTTTLRAYDYNAVFVRVHGQVTWPNIDHVVELQWISACLCASDNIAATQKIPFVEIYDLAQFVNSDWNLCIISSVLNQEKRQYFQGTGNSKMTTGVANYLNEQAKHISAAVDQTLKRGARDLVSRICEMIKADKFYKGGWGLDD